jgi:hypothetical protein
VRDGNTIVRVREEEEEEEEERGGGEEENTKLQPASSPKAKKGKGAEHSPKAPDRGHKNELRCSKRAKRAVGA